MTKYRRPQLLAGLVWEEISGVTDPANLLPGWMVRKSRRIAADRPLLDFDVVEKSADKQYTFGVVYAASTEDVLVADAQGEAILAEELQKAAWEYAKTGDRRVYAQHGEQGIIPLGEWVDLVSWPYEVTTKLTVPGEKAQQVTIPANSVFMGILWNDRGWELVKSGQIKGLSLGGRARRKTAEETESMTKKTPLQEEFDQFLAGLKAAMTGPQYKALMSLLRVLVVGEQDLDNPAGAGQKTRFAPTVENMEKLLEDMKSLDLSDETCVDVVRFLLHGNPLHPTFGDSTPGPVDEETSKAVGDSGLGVVVMKVMRAAYKQHGRPLMAGLDAKLAKGLDEEAD